MALRSQLPSRSPLSAAALVAGLRCAADGGREALDWLEHRLRDVYRARGVLLTDSGTSALRLALEAAPPAPAALPAYSCYDLATAAVGAGVPALLYDVRSDTLGPDLASLDRALASGAGTVVVAPLFGLPVEMEPVEARCREAGALLVEDAAQEIGAAYRGAPVGARGSLAVLSFNRGKGWTGGCGGALLAHDAAGAEALERAAARVADAGRGLGPWAQAAAQWALGRPAIYGLPRRLPFLGLGQTTYRAPEPPRRLPAAAAGVLRATASALEAETAARRAHAERLLKRIWAGSRLSAPVVPEGAEPSWIRLPALLPEGRADRDGEFDPPTRLGVYRGYPAPLHRLPALADRLVGRTGPFPGADVLARRLVTFPTHGALRERDLRALEEWVARA